MNTIQALCRKTALVFLIAALPVFFAGAQQNRPQAASPFPSLEASAAAYDFARRVSLNTVHWRDLAEAALWASAVNTGAGAEDRALALLSRIDALAAELAASPNLPQDPGGRADYVLLFLHRSLFRAYSEFQTRVDEVFASGRSNCVSSAVLYLVLAQSVGLTVEGVMTRDHAFATVLVGTQRVDVETTTRYGFDPGNRREFHDAFGRLTGFTYVPATNTADRMAISGPELVSLILSNRIALLERSNRFTEAVPLAINRAVFLSGAPAAASSAHQAEFFENPRQNLMTRLFNVGAHLVRTGRDEEAFAWVEYAQSRFPDPHWQEITHAAAHNQLVRLIRARRLTDARAALTAVQPQLGSTYTAKLDAMVLEAEAAALVNGIRNPGDAQAALAFLDQAGERLSAGRRSEMRSVAILSEANRLGRTRDWNAAMQWLERSIQTYGATAAFDSALRTMRQNRINELHNEFAALFNRRDFTAARTLAQQALQEFPGDRQLVQNLARAENALQQ